MRNVYTAEIARLRFTVINARTGTLVAAFADCDQACLMRDEGPRNSQGQTLYVVGEQEVKITKPRLRQRRRAEPRQCAPLRDLVGQPEILDANTFQRSAV